MNEKTLDTRPWYRHRWPWILMAGPFLVVIAGIVTAILAFRSNDGLVADDYYKQGLAINQTTARDQQARRLGLVAEVMSSGRGVRVMLRANPGESLPGVLSLRVAHPTQAGADQIVSLQRQAEGVYAGQLETPLTGRWQVSLQDERREWRLTGEWRVETVPVLRMP